VRARLHAVATEARSCGGRPGVAGKGHNILWWDGPERNGLYGYAEPLMYREPRRETDTVSRWKQVLTRGAVHGRVTDQHGAPVAGALVIAYDGKSALTGGDGRYELHDVPFGRYELSASRVIDGVLFAARVPIDLQVADLTCDIALQPPADRFRRAQVYLDFWGKDDEASSTRRSTTRARSTTSSSSARTASPTRSTARTSGAARSASSTTSC
jgi:hypothetical protein